jgi:hypothetical protein
MRIILPKDFTSVDFSYGPLFFLAGPVRGADDWRKDCVGKISNYTQDFYAALPCRYGEGHPLLSFHRPTTKNHFGRQTLWERFYLESASKHGCIIFWLPCESKTNPRSDGNPYARDTYGELAEWRGQLMYNQRIRVVIGAERGFPGLSQIKCNFDAAIRINYPIYSTLEGTVDAAINKVDFPKK